MSMVNICESVIKIVMPNEPKWLSFGKQAPAKRQRGSERGLNDAASWMVNSPVDSRYLNSHMLQLRNVETPYVSLGALAPRDGCAARQADRGAGLRCRKKRTPRCNGADTG